MDQKTPGLLLEEELKCGLVPILQLRAHLDPLASVQTLLDHKVSPLFGNASDYEESRNLLNGIKLVIGGLLIMESLFYFGRLKVMLHII